MPAVSGQLDRRIALQRRFAETDESGQAVEHWEEIAKVWARVEPLGGREDFGQEQFVAVGDVRFTIRWRRQRDVTPLERIVYDGREYDIVSVAEDGRRQMLLIVAKARAEGTPE